MIHTNFDDVDNLVTDTAQNVKGTNYVLTPGNPWVAAGEPDLQTGVYHRDVNLVTQTKLCFNIRKCKSYVWGACAAGPDLQTLGFTTVNHGVMYERPQPYQPHASQADQMFKCDVCGTWFNPTRRVENQWKMSTRKSIHHIWVVVSPEWSNRKHKKPSCRKASNKSNQF